MVDGTKMMEVALLKKTHNFLFIPYALHVLADSKGKCTV